MAQKINVTLVDDIDGTEAAETITFGFDGTHYEIDLNSKHANKLRTELGKFAESARRVSKPGTKSRRASSGGPQLRNVRAWAEEQGYRISTHGRVPRNVMDAYRAAH